MTRPGCTIDGCGRTRRYRLYCQKHYDAARDRDERNALRKRQRDANHEAVRAYNARYYAENRDREAERCRAWREANLDRHRENFRRWGEENPEKRRAQWQRKHARRYARIKATSTEPVDYAAVIERHGMWCYLCEQDILTLDDLHLDHVIPLAKGGQHTEDNLRPAHALCNQRKGAKILASAPDEYAVAP